MRTTKADLQHQLETAARFNRLNLCFVGPQAERRVRAKAGFFSIDCYPLGAFPLNREIGMRNFVRYIQKAP